MNRKNSYLMGMFSGLTLGILTGWLVAMLIKDKNPKIKHKFKPFKKFVGNENNWRIKEIFGEITDDAVNIYQEVKRQLIKNLENAELALNKFDERNYRYIVQDTIREIQRKIRLSDDKAERLQKYLENDYEMIKTKLENQRENNGSANNFLYFSDYIYFNFLNIINFFHNYFNNY